MEPLLYKKEAVTCSQMKELEQAADAAGLSYYQMMENAGTLAAEEILRQYPAPERAVIFCGKGNNGGDGFVAARKFLEKGIDTAVVLVEGDPVTEDAAANLRLIREKIQIFDARAFLEKAEAEPWRNADLFADAIYGTGFHGSLRKPADEIITFFNDARAFKAAMDLPSGLSGDMAAGETGELCIHADLTITFHAKKPVHLCAGAEAAMGQVVCADIGIRQALENGEKNL